MKRRTGQDMPEWGIVVAFVTVITMVVVMNFVPKMSVGMHYIMDTFDEGRVLMQQNSAE